MNGAVLIIAKDERTADGPVSACAGAFFTHFFFCTGISALAAVFGVIVLFDAVCTITNEIPGAFFAFAILALVPCCTGIVTLPAVPRVFACIIYITVALGCTHIRNTAAIVADLAVFTMFAAVSAVCRIRAYIDFETIAVHHAVVAG